MTDSQLELERSRRAPGTPDAVLVEDLIERLGKTLDLVPPTNLHVAASFQKIGRICFGDIDQAGMLSPMEDGTFCMTVRASDRSHRQNFTIAHEIVHTYLPGYTVVQYRCGSDGSMSRPAVNHHIENLADVGAAELLLPRRYLRDEFSRIPYEVAAVKRIADFHHASLEATLRRLLRLGDRPAILLDLRQIRRSEGSFETVVHRVYSNSDWCPVAPRQLHGLRVPKSHPLSATFGHGPLEAVANLDILGTNSRVANLSALNDPYTDYQGNLVMRSLVLATPHYPSDHRSRESHSPVYSLEGASLR